MSLILQRSVENPKNPHSIKYIALRCASLAERLQFALGTRICVLLAALSCEGDSLGPGLSSGAPARVSLALPQALTKEAKNPYICARAGGEIYCTQLTSFGLLHIYQSVSRTALKRRRRWWWRVAYTHTYNMYLVVAAAGASGACARRACE
jgi:hypothetical protein